MPFFFHLAFKLESSKLTPMNFPSSPIQKQLNPALRWVLLLVGFVAIALAIIGILLPVLPTVPFLLLALGCFARSSDHFYAWLLDHAHLGPLVRPFLQGNGIPRTSKLKAIALIWISMTLSVLFFLETLWVRVCLLVIALGVTIYLLYLPTAGSDDHSKADPF
ncbi:MAG: YbaN family protein [Thermodesulfobacteriota bacterium]|nr:YbaN family protein [Thermodesulfobacteriota bacterium]